MYTISSSAALYVTMLILPPKHFDIHLAKSQFLDMFVTCYIDEYSLILWLPPQTYTFQLKIEHI